MALGLQLDKGESGELKSWSENMLLEVVKGEIN